MKQRPSGVRGPQKNCGSKQTKQTTTGVENAQALC